jgi:hypothetical protein
VWFVMVRHGKVRLGRIGKLRLGKVWYCELRSVPVWHFPVSLGRRGTAWSGKVRFGVVRRGEAGMVWQSLEGN